MGLDRGQAAWLNLEQVASIIQLHNTGRSIVTTHAACNGCKARRGRTGPRYGHTCERQREQHCSSGGDGEASNTGKGYRDALRPTALPAQTDGISGIYPMNMPGHWRVMTVSHALRQVVLLDPLGDEFTIPEFDNVKYSYSGYNVSRLGQNACRLTVGTVGFGMA